MPTCYRLLLVAASIIATLAPSTVPASTVSISYSPPLYSYGATGTYKPISAGVLSAPKYTLRLKQTASNGAVADTVSEACIKVSGSISAVSSSASSLSWVSNWEATVSVNNYESQSGSYSVTLSNTCPFAITAYLGLWNTNAGSPAGEWVTVAPPKTCSYNMPDTLDLGSVPRPALFTGSVRSETKLNITGGTCDSGVTLTVSGTSSGDGNFQLGDDVKMKLSYNYGANQIINGQPFSPAASQVVDIDLLPLKSSAPAPGVKTTSLTVTLNVL